MSLLSTSTQQILTVKVSHERIIKRKKKMWGGECWMITNTECSLQLTCLWPCARYLVSIESSTWVLLGSCQECSQLSAILRYKYVLDIVRQLTYSSDHVIICITSDKSHYSFHRVLLLSSLMQATTSLCKRIIEKSKLQVKCFIYTRNNHFSELKNSAGLALANLAFQTKQGLPKQGALF